MTADLEQRRRAIEEAHQSFIVEASAGTGKTSVLIRRILHCVLDAGPDGEPLSLSRICAITFTEKAAGEMKIRLRQEFEKRASGKDDANLRARKALEELESAAISTFHSFAVSLLKERPIEAGLDPRFTPLDEMQGELLFQEVWEAWLQNSIQLRKPALERALRVGIGLDALRSAARTLRQHAHSVRQLQLPAPPSDNEVRQQLTRLLEEGRELLGLALDANDKLVPYMEEALEWLANPEAAAELSKPGTKGAAGNWQGGKPTVARVRVFVKEVVDLRVQLPLLPARRALDEVLRLILEEFLPEWEARKRSRGFLDFDDLLWCAHHLLSTCPAARVEFQRRFSALLVDEFQDTDPIQWEIIRLLAAPDDGSKAIAPGRLFIVGDPKQSIYRFRGADIETYGQVAEAAAMVQLGLQRLELTTNFRSVPSILNFVDEAFRDVMKKADDTAYQPDYLAFGGQGDRQGNSRRTCVHILGDRKADGNLAGSDSDFFTVECRRIAGLIRAIRDGIGWEVESASPLGRAWHPPRYRDIAILLPVLTRADELEDALRTSGIPYVLEGGKFYYARSEVSSAITVLRAVANPNDEVALYGALRSIFFGVSDESLLRARMAGLPLDYRREVAGKSILSRAYQVLMELHLYRHERQASETLERLFQQTGAREALAARGTQSLANLQKLVRTLRSLQRDMTFSGVVELISGMDEEGASESESRVMEEQSDAVRVLSIHRAKGLDFQVVIVAGLGLKRLARRADFLADPHGSGTFGIRVGSKESGLQTPGWEELVQREKEHEDAEMTRLLYVALTRARDHLVLGAHTRGKGAPDDTVLDPGFKGTRLEPLSEFLTDITSRPEGLVDFPAFGESGPGAMRLPAESDVSLRSGCDLKTQYGELNRLITQTPASRDLHAVTEGEEHKSDSDLAMVPALDAAVRLGIAFHEAMDLADLGDVSAGPSLAREAGVRHGLDVAAIQALERMLVETLGSALMSRVRRAQSAGGRVMREVPYARPLGPGHAGIEQGKIDLLFEEDGAWVLVDYKTDLLPAEPIDAGSFFREKYAGQLRAYAAALQTLGIHLSNAYLLLARSGACVECGPNQART